ncbi:MAG: hypothetical protein V1494_03705 [Candidatus Diapherotrites archaeon]
MASINTLLMLGFDWFVLLAIIVLSIRSIIAVTPFVNDAVIAKTIWYLLLAFGYSVIAMTIFTSWVIWFVGGFWAILVLLLPWFVLFFIFFAYKKLSEDVVEKVLMAESKNRKKITF